MSIVESLRRLVDPVAVRHEELSRKAEREQPRPETAGDPPSRYRCRVCGETGSDGGYCPQCLADTMEKMAGPKRDG